MAPNLQMRTDQARPIDQERDNGLTTGPTICVMEPHGGCWPSHGHWQVCPCGSKSLGLTLSVLSLFPGAMQPILAGLSMWIKSLALTFSVENLFHGATLLMLAKPRALAGLPLWIKSLGLTLSVLNLFHGATWPIKDRNLSTMSGTLRLCLSDWLVLFLWWAFILYHLMVASFPS